MLTARYRAAQGKTPLQLAVEKGGAADVAQLLLANGASANHLTPASPARAHALRAVEGRTHKHPRNHSALLAASAAA